MIAFDQLIADAERCKRECGARWDAHIERLRTAGASPQVGEPMVIFDRLSAAARRIGVPEITLRRHAKRNLLPGGFARWTGGDVDPDTGKPRRRRLEVQRDRLDQYVAEHPLKTRNDARKSNADTK
jgi:hypothetical protein